jgi:hypothetical protein
MGAMGTDGAFDSRAVWADCPGCKKCEKTEGLVLRKNGWRPTSSWEPILMLAKSPRYFCDAEAVKTRSAPATVERNQYTRIANDPDEQFGVRHDHETIGDGANLRDVWTISHEPLPQKHYAAYPTEIVYRCLAAGTSAKGYCPNPICGAPWTRIVESEFMGDNSGKRDDPHASGTLAQCPPVWGRTDTVGWRPSCRCVHDDPRPGVVLDPFSGSGRTGVEAGRLGLDFVGIDLNPSFVKMQRQILSDQLPLFNEIDAPLFD